MTISSFFISFFFKELAVDITFMCKVGKLSWRKKKGASKKKGRKKKK